MGGTRPSLGGGSADAASNVEFVVCYFGLFLLFVESAHTTSMEQAPTSSCMRGLSEDMF